MLHKAELVEKKKLKWERSPDTDLLVSKLRPLQETTFVSYEEIADFLGRKSISGADSHLTQARKILQKETGAIWDCVKGEGIRRLTHQEVLDSRPRGLRSRVFRSSKKTRAQLSTINTDEISNKSAFFASISFTEVLMHATKPKSFRKIEAAVSNQRSEEPLPIGIALKTIAE